MPARTYTYYDKDNNEVRYGGCMSPGSYFEESTGLKPGKFIKGSGFVYGIRDDGSKVAVHRVIGFKAQNPSLHKCDARCENATGGNCECSCRGKNHGINS